MDIVSESNYQEAIYTPLLLAQLFGIMPVRNISSKNPANLYFTWKSFRTCYAILTFIALFLYSLMTIHWSIFSGNIEFIKFVPVIFYTSNTYIVLAFIILARRWPGLMVKWLRVENGLPKYATLKERRRLSKKIKMVSIVIMTLSLSKLKLYYICKT